MARRARRPELPELGAGEAAERALGADALEVLAPDAVTLLVHASVQRSSQGRLLAFTVRPFRNSADRSDLLFAAAPRAVAMPTGDDGAALDEALSAALDETLPWLAAPARVRRIDP